MNILKAAAVFAIVALPFLLTKKERGDISQEGREVETDEIFDLELVD